MSDMVERAANAVHAEHMIAKGPLAAWSWDEANKDFYRRLVKAAIAAMQADAAPVDARVSTSNPVVDHETGNTSDKLRDAAEVYLAAGAAYWGTDTSETDAIGLKLAAAVIEADRQATRAALVAEIVEWLKGKAAYAWSRESELADEIEAKWSKP